MHHVMLILVNITLVSKCIFEVYINEAVFV